MSGRGSAELEASIFKQIVDEFELGGPAASNLSLGLLVWPHPCGINVAVAHCMHPELVCGVLVGLDEGVALCEGHVESGVVQGHQVLVCTVVDEVKVPMAACALVFVEEFCSISDHDQVVVVGVDLRIEKADLTFLKGEFLFHVDFSVAPLVVSDEIAEHLLRSKLQQILNNDSLACLLGNEFFVDQIISRIFRTNFNVVDIAQIFILGQSL